jgi:hypothetical protein
VSRLGGDHEHWQVAVHFDLLQFFHHLKTIHARHLQIEQYQVIAVLEVQFADRARIGGGGDGGIPRAEQKALQQTYVSFQIVDYQNLGVIDVGVRNHKIRFLYVVRISFAAQSYRAGRSR